MIEYLFKHFKDMRHDGFLNNISITLIDKIDGKNPKKRKNYWRKTLETYSPFERNAEDIFWPRISESLAGCRTKFLFAVFCKIGALERNAYWFHV